MTNLALTPRRVFSVSVFAALLVLGIPSGLYGADPEAHRGTGGAVSSAVPRATETGLAILEAGGNAVDAAVATALALAVVHPQAGNLGGGGFAVVRFGDTVETLDFRETAPARATPGMYLDSAGKPRTDASLIGPLAAGVPGTPSGLFELHKRYGRLPWQTVVSPSVRLARDGFVVTRRLESTVASAEGLLRRFPETEAVWLPGGRPPKAGQVMRLPELAATLESYSRRGAAAITEGPIAAAVELAVRRHGGILVAADLAAYRPVWRMPLRFQAYGWEVASMPLPSSGGIILGETLGMLERLEWETKPRFGADRFHLLAEVWRRVYADRVLLGDPRTSQASAPQLLDGAWLDLRAKEIRSGKASNSEKISPWSRALVPESAETTHLSVMDADGNTVAMTTTLNGRFGCGLVVRGAGFFLNNEMDDFTAAPGVPNLYGLVQGEANSVAAGKRMLSSMTPTIAWQGDNVIVVGSPGGSRIPTATAQVLLNLIVDGDELQAAVDRPRIHHQWMPDVLYVEPYAVSPDTAKVLERRGHRIEVKNRIGEVSAVRGIAGGLVAAAQDPRGPGGGGVVIPAVE